MELERMGSGEELNCELSLRHVDSNGPRPLLQSGHRGGSLEVGFAAELRCTLMLIVPP